MAQPLLRDRIAEQRALRRSADDAAASLFDACGVALLGLRALRDARGLVQDWQVLSANPALGELIGIDVDALVGRRIGAAWPAWLALDLGADCVTTLRAGQPHTCTRLLPQDRGEARQAVVQIGAWAGGVVLSLTDLSLWLAPHLPSSRQAAQPDHADWADTQSHPAEWQVTDLGEADTAWDMLFDAHGHARGAQAAA
ncbi:MAG: hypothetical protein AB9M60_19550 [Leptothrix sp. (in: b-proteobacteria)]